MKKIYLVDVSSIFFRAFYAIRQLNNSKGIPTNATYGFLAAITKLLKEHKPDFLAFCFDGPEDGFREEIYADYKANRSEAPDDLVKQLPYLPKIAEALSVATFAKPGYEADDLIGSLAKKAKAQGREVVIVSGDKDFAQLVEPGVRIFDPSKDTYMAADEVRGKFGVAPEQIIDYLALVGDASDNVPGVRGVGPKAAQKLLAEFQTLEGIYENLEKIKNDRMRELLSSQKKEAFLSKKLVTIVTDMDIAYSDDLISVKPPKNDLLVPLLQELEFKTLLQRLLGSEGGTATPAQVTVVSSESAALEPLKFDLHQTADIADLEKAFLKNLEKDNSQTLWLEASQTGLALGLGHSLFRFEGNIQKINQWVGEFARKTKIKLSGYDTKSLAHQFNLSGPDFIGVGSDVLLQAYGLGHGGDLEFKSLAKIHLDQTLPELMSPEEKLSVTIRLSQQIQHDLVKNETDQVLTKIEYPLAPVLYRMERVGVLIDRDLLGKYSKELKQETLKLEKEIFQIVGYEFNVGSPKQLGQILFEKLKLPTVRKTKTGYSTDSDVLEKLKSQHPICEKILNWRELTKLNSTYVEALPQMIRPETGRVHTSYNQAVTTTGRLSSTNPNLQNIPIRTARGQKIRNSFIAEQGSEVLSADYSQVELRILAHITDDPNLKKAFQENLDVHTATAAEVFKVKLEDVTSDQRRTAKAINFGIVYGMSDFGLAEGLAIDRKQAAEFIGRYFERYPGVKKYMNEIVQEGTEKGYVQTMFGRKRYYAGLKSSNRMVRQMAERAAINMPIQGAAADIIKLAMIHIDQELRTKRLTGKMIMQVHDELVFEVKKENAAELSSQVQKWMGETTKLKVPLNVDVELGTHW